MTTLESQYKNYLLENPTSTLTYDEWLDQLWSPIISDNFQIGPDGAFEWVDEHYSSENEEMKDWDNTLLDGLEDE